MNKLLHLFSVIGILCNSICAQETFELLISNPSHEFILDCIEDQEGNFYLVGENSYSENSQPTLKCGVIYKIDPAGIILHQKEYCYPDSILTFSQIELINDSIFIFGGSGSIEISQKDFFEIYILDLELELINRSKRKLFSDKYLSIRTHLVTPGGEFVVNGIAITVGELLDSDIFFYQFTQDMDSVKCFVDAREYDQAGFDFTQDHESGGYKVFGFGSYPGSTVGYDELIHFDSVFNFIAVDTLAWKIRGQHSVIWVTDSTYLVTGRKYLNVPINVEMAVVMLNLEDELMDVLSIGKGVDTVDHEGVKDNIDFVTKDNIFYGGTSNFIVDQWPWQTDDSWINLVNMDSNLNVNWQRYYGGDAFYHVWGLLATQDGGCLVYAERFDENTQFQEYDVYIMKVDSNGLLTSVGEIPNIAANELFIYPNPANEKITVQFPGVTHFRQKELCIYNNLGSIAWQGEIPDRQERMSVNISHLPTGLYHAVIRSYRESVASGKLLIAR